MKVAVLDDIHHAYDGTAGIRRLREHAEVRIFTAPFYARFAAAACKVLLAYQAGTDVPRFA